MKQSCAGLILLLAASGSAAAASHPLEVPAALEAALHSLRNGQYKETLEASQKLQEDYPSHPLAFLIAAESAWGLIFCETGHINSREIWSLAEDKASTFDDAFFQSVEAGLAAAKVMRETSDTAAIGAFYEGMAHGVRARLYTLRAEVLSSGRAGKQMREALLEAASLDAELQADAETGLGVYDYYADALSPFVKFFRFFLLIPGGDRERGMAQLESASRNALLVAPEARYELAKIYGLREDRPGDALPLFIGLADQYPDNAFFALSAAIQAERAGDKELAADLARKAAQSAGQMDDVCRARLEPASQQAVERLSGSSH
jgi:hypothetical protein